ncbi:hypothetical protein THRCLA_21287 [Thraustotheca clavata]|uniref:Uncharacterized protein n=1 Tax=Thraustotheca clavata TaxID=74557 RepID=A0A1V9ZYB0_9STRA|nr:hypothetical protein THRCLA_21287 [Thraustotheca clavata]
MREVSISTKRAIVEKVQTRYKQQDAYLLRDLDTDYDYIVKALDPIFSEALEAVMLYKPEQVALFLSQFLAGTLDLEKVKRSNLQTQFYFDRKVREVMALAMDSTVQEHPTDIRAFLADFFDKRINIY